MSRYRTFLDHCAAARCMRDADYSGANRSQPAGSAEARGRVTGRDGERRVKPEDTRCRVTRVTHRYDILRLRDTVHVVIPEADCVGLSLAWQRLSERSL